jgi:hypothetical protein
MVCPGSTGYHSSVPPPRVDLLSTAAALLRRAQRLNTSTAHPFARRTVASVVLRVIDAHAALRRNASMTKADRDGLRVLLELQSARLDAIEPGLTRRKRDTDATAAE